MPKLQRVKNVVDWLIYKEKIKSRKELADKMGYTESSISQIINGKVTLSDRFIKKLSILDEAINQDWILTGNGEMLNWPDNLEKPKVNEQVYYGGGEAETISMPREVFNQITKLTETILSQQRVIESQTGTIETLIENGKKTVALMEDNATNADVKKASGA